MIEQTAEIVRVDRDSLTVRIDHQSACGSCQMNGVCGHSSLLKLLGSREIKLAATGQHYKPGDKALIRVDQGELLRASFLQFGVPIIAMLFAAIASHYLFSGNQAWVISWGLLGFILGLLSARFIAKAQYQQGLELIYAGDSERFN